MIEMNVVYCLVLVIYIGQVRGQDDGGLLAAAAAHMVYKAFVMEKASVADWASQLGLVLNGHMCSSKWRGWLIMQGGSKSV